MESLFTKWGHIVAGRVTKWVTLIVWVLAAALLSAIGPNLNQQENNNAATLPPSAQSVQAEKRIKQSFPNENRDTAIIVWYRQGGLTSGDIAQVKQLAANLTNHPLQEQSGLPPLQNMPAQTLKAFTSKDGSTLELPIAFNQGADPTVLQKTVDALNARIASVAGPSALSSAIDASGLHVRVTGPVGITADAQGLFKNADVKLLMATMLLVLVLLILLYRSPILALVPLIGVGFAYGVIAPILGWLAKAGVIVVDAQSVSIMTVLLFGAGTDYSLFLVARYRDFLHSENDKHVAIRKALGGAAGAIGMSGLTVALSLLTLLFAKYGSDERFAVPFSLSILGMVLAALTLVPALLAIFGRTSFFPFVPRTERMWDAWSKKTGKKPRRAANQSGRFGEFIGRAVTRRPWPIVLITVVVLSVLSIFAGQVKPTYNLLASFPKSMPSRQGYDLLAKHFSPGALAPVQVIVHSSSDGTAVQHALQQLSFVDAVGSPAASTVRPTDKLLSVTLKDNPYSSAAMNDIPALLKTAQQALTNDGSSPAVGAMKSQVWVGGLTATQYDTMAYTNRDTRTIIPLVIGVIALLLLVYLRSVVATLYLLATVLLSYFAALGIGWVVLHYLMGVSAIAGAIPLYAFVFLVALGEDYNIFVISRIWEAKNRMPMKDAIAYGTSQTSSVITSAGLILAATFVALTGLPLQMLLQFGLVTAIGVLIDTFIVRPFLVPSITALLGKRALWPLRAKHD
jgi:putative drug exporter of the RND superfamily